MSIVDQCVSDFFTVTECKKYHGKWIPTVAWKHLIVQTTDKVYTESAVTRALKLLTSKLGRPYPSPFQPIPVSTISVGISVPTLSVNRFDFPVFKPFQIGEESEFCGFEQQIGEVPDLTGLMYNYDSTSSKKLSYTSTELQRVRHSS